jgi:hypothetical protein
MTARGKALLALLLCVLFAARVTGLDCDYSNRGPAWLRCDRVDGDYAVKVADPATVLRELNWNSAAAPYARARQLPPHMNTFPVTEFLAREVGAVVFYVGSSGTVVPLPLNGTWRGDDPLSCLQTFAQAAGLEVVIPQPGLWLIGQAQFVEKAAVFAFAYPMDPSLQPRQDQGGFADLERAFLADLPIRESRRPIQRDDTTWDVGVTMVGVGYYAIPGEPETYLLVGTLGTSTSASVSYDVLETRAFKVRAERQSGRVKVRCLWAQRVTGPLVARVQEDLDGDGVQDFYFQAAGDTDQPDMILSGTDGSLLAKVAGDTLVVEKGTVGPKMFSVNMIWEDDARAQVHRFNPKTREVDTIAPLTVAPESVAGTPPTQTRTFDRPADALEARLGSFSRVRAYCLPGFRIPSAPGMELVQTRLSPVWSWLLNRNAREAVENVPANLPMHVIFKYVSPGYLEDQKREQQKQP